MLGLYFDGREVTLRDDLPAPKPGPNEALVAVRLAGVCRTDLEVVRGYMNFTGVMGHEFVGEVVSGPEKWPGRRVVGEINCVCGRCDLCLAGLSNHCRDHTVLGIDRRDGVFAEYVALPVENLHEVPPHVSDLSAVMTEPLAAAFQVIRQVDLSHAREIVVLGDGRLGQLIARVLRWYAVQQRMDYTLTLVGKHGWKLGFAQSQRIATQTVRDFRSRRTADVVVEATGTAEGFELAMRTVRPRGVIVLKSTFATGRPMNLASLVIDEITVVGSRCGPFDWALAAMADAHPIEVESLVTRRFPLSEGLAALETAGRAEVLKVVLDVTV